MTRLRLTKDQQSKLRIRAFHAFMHLYRPFAPMWYRFGMALAASAGDIQDWRALREWVETMESRRQRKVRI